MSSNLRDKMSCLCCVKCEMTRDSLSCFLLVFLCSIISVFKLFVFLLLFVWARVNILVFRSCDLGHTWWSFLSCMFCL